MRVGRRGRGQIKTAQQLAVDLTIPIYYILMGQAQAAFPESTVASPSSFVMIIKTGSGLDPHHEMRFPAYVNWRQWRDVLAPLLQDITTPDTEGGNTTPSGGYPQPEDPDYSESPQWSAYLGSLGGSTGLGALPDALLGNGLYGCTPGLRTEYLRLLASEIQNRAITAGYPNPA